jgi:hypothetical protein
VLFEYLFWDTIPNSNQTDEDVHYVWLLLYCITHNYLSFFRLYIVWVCFNTLCNCMYVLSVNNCLDLIALWNLVLTVTSSISGPVFRTTDQWNEWNYVAMYVCKIFGQTLQPRSEDDDRCGSLRRYTSLDLWCGRLMIISNYVQNHITHIKWTRWHGCEMEVTGRFSVR